ncbi:MAG: ABC transporter substrate-binding protein [Lachnospiraceae bacterium]
MKQKRRGLYYSLILFMTILLFSGCQSDGSSTSQAHEDVVIRWMVYGEKSKSSDTVIKRFNERLQEQFPDTTVEFEIVPMESYKERWDMLMAVNEPMDIAWIGSDEFNYTEEVNKGSFMALDYLLSIAGQQLLEEIPEEILAKQKRDGKTYGIPLLGPLYRKDYAVVVNKSDMQLYGDSTLIQEVNQSKEYSDEESYEVFESYLSQMAEAQKLGTGISCGTFKEIAQKGYEGIYGPDSPFVIKIFDDTLTIYNKYEQESYKAYFKTISEWYQKGYIREDINEVIAPENENGVKAGNLFYLDEYGENGVVLDALVPEYESIAIPLQNYKYIGYESNRNALVIPRTTENPQRAVEIINYINSEEGADLCRLLSNGLEGRHYVKHGTNLINSVLDSSGAPIYSLSAYSVGNAFLNYEKTKGELGQIEQYNDSALLSPLLGFELDTRMIIIELEQIDLIVEDYLERLLNGTSEDWEVQYNEMITKMYDAGAEKVLEEIQRQLNAFSES